jgi:hypothetical protein
MAVAAPSDLLDVTTADALEEKKKLRKHFARFDIVFFLIWLPSVSTGLAESGSRLGGGGSGK